jgi:triosephosphate isomerase
MEALMRVGLVPILCVGETLAEREAGRTEDVIREQLEGAFQGFTEGDMAKTVVAYEPVWAIGTGQTCAADEANRVCAFIRQWFPAGVQAQVRVLYGGSVKAENAAELFGQCDIDGGLVGGASLDAAGFRRIVEAAAP